jgi:HPt (histidine-containing phosphotransfer) domain-containing protein
VGQETARAAVLMEAQVALRALFVAEVAERLPHLVQLLEPENTVDRETAHRDAHTLASGAWVVGEPEIARLAREVEQDLDEGPVTELVALLQTVLRPVP